MRRPVVVVLLTLMVLGLATPAWAQDGQDLEAFVVLSGRADVPEGEQVGDLVVFHGSSAVDGTVDGSLTAFDAPVTISGGASESLRHLGREIPDQARGAVTVAAPAVVDGMPGVRRVLR
jgi:hypothetical protein